MDELPVDVALCSTSRLAIAREKKSLIGGTLKSLVSYNRRYPLDKEHSDTA